MILGFKLTDFFIHKIHNYEEKPSNNNWKFSFYDSIYYLSIIIPILEFINNGYTSISLNIIIGTFMIIVGILIVVTAELGFTSYKNVKHEKNMKIYYYVRFPFSLSDFLFLSGISISLQSAYGAIVVLLFLIIEIMRIKKIDKTYQQTIPGYKEYKSQTKLVIPFLI